MKPKRGSRHGLALLGVAVVVACQAKPAAEAPKTAEPAAAGDASGAAPAMQMPGAGTLGGAEEAGPGGDLSRAERELDAALGGQDAAGQPLATPDRCTTVCRALASMRRAADEICRLEEARCTSARGRVTKAEERAKEACPTCAAPT